jgi:hypothetical protein
MGKRSPGAVVEDRRKQPFAMVSVELIDRFGPLITKKYGLAVYVVLARYVNNKTHTVLLHNVVIAKKLGISQPSVTRAIKLLIHYHLIKFESGKEEGRANRYLLLDLPPLKKPGTTPLFDEQDDLGLSRVKDNPPSPTNGNRASMTCESNFGVSFTGERPESLGLSLVEDGSITGGRRVDQISDRNKGTSRLVQIKPTTTAAALDRSRISKLLSHFCPDFDPPVLDRIIRSVLHERSDATTDEVLHFIKVKGAQSLAQGIKNPSGFLIKAVPECFAGKAFEMWRANSRAEVGPTAAVEAVNVEADRKWVEANRDKLYPKGKTSSASAK